MNTNTNEEYIWLGMYMNGVLWRMRVKDEGFIIKRVKGEGRMIS